MSMKAYFQLSVDHPELFDDASSTVGELAKRYAKLKPGGRAAKTMDAVAGCLMDGALTLLELRKTPLGEGFSKTVQ